MIHLIPNNLLRRLTSYASVSVAAILIGAKIYAYFATGSVALLSSLVDSGVDLLASLISAYGVAQALKPADRDHRFGHGKAESLAALTQATFILVSSALLAWEAVQRFVKPQPLAEASVGYAAMGLAITLTLALLALQTYTVRRTKSMAIAADRLHYVGDVAINLAVVATFAFQDFFNLPWIDPLFALVISGSMCVGAIQITKNALTVLMDAELPEKERLAIVALAKTVPGVMGVHDLRTRTDSGHPIIEIHVEMSPTLTLVQAHDITEAVMAQIDSVYPGADVLIHQDPFGIKEKRLDIVIEKNDPTKE